jgi:hypothetical protein
MALFLASCESAVYIQYNSDGYYETPKMDYKIKKDNGSLNIAIHNKSTDRILDIFQTEIYVVFKADNKTVGTYNTITRPIYPKETINLAIKAPYESNRAYIRYDEYEYRGSPLVKFRKNHGYSYYGTFYLSWVNN